MSEKKIQISGTGTRYQMKKVIKNVEHVKERKAMDHLSLEMFSWEHQKSLLQMFTTKTNHGVDDDDETVSILTLIKKQITSKLNNYKQQDVLKKVFDERKMITLEQVIDKLQKCELKCHYCNEDIYLLYKIVREMKQWTLDRIDNDIGHFQENVVISCLGCNLKRRKKNSNAFLFTKQMNIIRVDHLNEGGVDSPLGGVDSPLGGVDSPLGENPIDS
jgi:hypothetical protein